MAGAGSQGFWGSVEGGGQQVMVNLRQVRYARPIEGGTALCFTETDRIVVTADFATVSRRLYAAYDESPPDDGAKQDDSEAGGDKQGGAGEDKPSGRD